ncbi:MAG: 4Fe-4S dicluster domain-containing protein [Deltaproteobacteria bacterium]|nr:4Fe-4S dicluster domain-containing protein [Deltaproteobacteria bacterium]
MPQYGFHVNIANCIGCRACEAACNQEYNSKPRTKRRSVIVTDGVGANGKPFMRFLSVACNHCEIPACLHACPVQRYVKDPNTGIVYIKPSKAEDAVNGVDCIGCRRCEAACPYGAPQFDPETMTMDKCTGCLHRITSTTLPVESRVPACVLTCSSNALHFGPLADLEGTKYGEATKTIGSAPDIADPTATNPSIRFSNKRA